MCLNPDSKICCFDVAKSSHDHDLVLVTCQKPPLRISNSPVSLCSEERPSDEVVSGFVRWDEQLSVWPLQNSSQDLQIYQVPQYIFLKYFISIGLINHLLEVAERI